MGIGGGRGAISRTVTGGRSANYNKALGLPTGHGDEPEVIKKRHLIQRKRTIVEGGGYIALVGGKKGALISENSKKG